MFPPGNSHTWLNWPSPSNTWISWYKSENPGCWAWIIISNSLANLWGSSVTLGNFFTMALDSALVYKTYKTWHQLGPLEGLILNGNILISSEEENIGKDSRENGTRGGTKDKEGGSGRQDGIKGRAWWGTGTCTSRRRNLRQSIQRRIGWTQILILRQWSRGGRAR